MTSALLLVVGLLSLLVLLLYGAMVELYRQVVQLRLHAGLTDGARPIEFDATARLADLPLAFPEAAAGRRADGPDRTTERRAVLILSDSCATCSQVAQGLRAAPRAPGLAVLAEARTRADAQRWLQAQGLDEPPEPGEPGAPDRVAYDDGGRIAERLGVSVTPAVVQFEGGVALSASTVPSAGQLAAVTEWLQGAAVDPMTTGDSIDAGEVRSR